MHKHHIIPKHEWKKRFGSLEGFNAPDNIVYLTVEQHAQAHHLLFELNGYEYDRIAYQALSGMIGKEELIRQVMIAANTGKPKSLEYRAKMSEAHKGKTFSLEHRAKMSVAQRGRRHSTESRQKISIGLLGNQNNLNKTHSIETRQKMSMTRKSAEYRAKISSSALARV